MGLSKLNVTFDFSSNNIIVVTGRNGSGKTTLIEALHLISDPKTFEKTSSIGSVRPSSSIAYNLGEHDPFTFSYNPQVRVLDTRDRLPKKQAFKSELPIPHGDRFRHFSLVAKYDSDLRGNIASSDYEEAIELSEFLVDVYRAPGRYNDLMKTRIKNLDFYFKLLPDDYYLREDHFSSGEFFLIQLFRMVTSGAELIIIDELDVSLDSSAQVHLFEAVKPILEGRNSNLIVVSHSLPFMKTASNDGLYYLESGENGSLLEKRSYGYVKSDLYGFKGKDRYIITEDEILVGFLRYLIAASKINIFYEYEIIAVGGQPQIDAITRKNDALEIFAPSDDVIVVVDKDIRSQLKYSGPTKIFTSPVNDIELFIWENREKYLSDVVLKEFKSANKEKATAKTYWKKVVGSEQMTKDQLYRIVFEANRAETQELIRGLQRHLCLD